MPQSNEIIQCKGGMTLCVYSCRWEGSRWEGQVCFYRGEGFSNGEREGPEAGPWPGWDSR